MSFSYEISSNENYCTITLTGRLMADEYSEGLLEEVSNVANNGTSNFLLNLKELDYINSSGINMLVNILTKSRSKGGEVVLYDVSEKVQKLFIITKLNTVFSVAKDKTEALGILNNSLTGN